MTELPPIEDTTLRNKKGDPINCIRCDASEVGFFLCPRCFFKGLRGPEEDEYRRCYAFVMNDIAKKQHNIQTE